MIWGSWERDRGEGVHGHGWTEEEDVGKERLLEHVKQLRGKMRDTEMGIKSFAVWCHFLLSLQNSPEIWGSSLLVFDEVPVPRQGCLPHSVHSICCLYHQNLNLVQGRKCVCAKHLTPQVSLLMVKSYDLLWPVRCNLQFTEWDLQKSGYFSLFPCRCLQLLGLQVYTTMSGCNWTILYAFPNRM